MARQTLYKFLTQKGDELMLEVKTLAKVLMGIDQASAGQIILDGTDISDYDINHRAEAGIGYAFQQPPRFKGMTVSKLLSLAAG